MSILRATVLRQMEIKETPDGKQVVFSIKFIKKDGSIVYVPRAVATGLKYNMKETRQRGILPVDEFGSRIAHVYPVHIDNIIEFNDQKVKI